VLETPSTKASNKGLIDSKVKVIIIELAAGLETE